MVAMKGAIPHTTPLFLAAVRLVPAGLLVLLFAWFQGRSQPQSWRAWLWISLFALVDGSLFQGFLAAGLVKTRAGLGSVIIDAQPLVVALLAWGLFGEYIGVWGWLGLGVGLIGITILGLPAAWFLGDFSGLGLESNGEGLMVLASLSMASGTVMMRLVARYADPVVATGWHLVLGGVPLLVLSARWETTQVSQMVGLDWLALGYATFFGSALAYGLFFYFAAQGNLTSLSALTFLTPVFALLFGYLFLAEVLSSYQWLGVSLTLISVVLINQRERLAHHWSHTKGFMASGQGLLPSGRLRDGLAPSLGQDVAVLPDADRDDKPGCQEPVC